MTLRVRITIFSCVENFIIMENVENRSGRGMLLVSEQTEQTVNSYFPAPNNVPEESSGRFRDSLVLHIEYVKNATARFSL